MALPILAKILKPHGKNLTIAPDDFISYDAPASEISSMNIAIGHTLLSDIELQKIKKAAFNSKAQDELKAIIQKEREMLHNRSKDSVKNWDNTVMGQRNKRLAAQTERQKNSEAERLKVDAEWGVIKTEERKLAVERARRMQYNDQSRVKALHARLLMSNVLQEREQQILRRAHLDEAVNTVSLRNSTLRQSMIDTENKREDETREKARLETCYVAQYQRDQMIKKDLQEKEKRQAEKDFYNAANQIILEEKKQIEDLEKKRHLEQMQNMKDGLADNIKSKRELTEQKKKLEADIDQQNERHQTIKLEVAKTRKQKEKSNFSERQYRVERVSQLAQDANMNKDKEIEEFIEKSIKWDWGGQIKNEYEKKIKSKKMIEEIEKHRHQQIAEVKVIKEVEKQEDLITRKLFEVKFLQQQDKNRKKKEEKDEKCHALQDFHVRQMEEKKSLLQLKKHDELTSELALLNTLDHENNEFENYATKMIKEWSDKGKDIRPALRVLFTGKPFPEIGQKPQDTFERLGFSVRRLDTFKRKKTDVLGFE